MYSQQSCKIQGNQPLILNNPEIVWMVVSGQVSVFATEMKNNEPEGNRHYLFTVEKGQGLFGHCSDSSGQALLAVAIEGAELESVAIQDLVKQISQKDPKAIAILESWIRHLGKSINQMPLNNVIKIINPDFSSYFSLEDKQIIQSFSEQIIWVEIREGEVDYLGKPELTLEINSPLFPLANRMWLKSENASQLKITTTDTIEQSEEITHSLELLHNYFYYYLNQKFIEDKEAEFRRFQARQQLNSQVTQSALGKLTSILKPGYDVFFGSGTPLLIAAGAVGRAMQIVIKPPSASEDMSKLANPLEAIAYASQCRIRSVRLVGDWWLSEHGPLLGYNQDNCPVALLPNPQKNSIYLLFDPIKKTRTPVNQDVAQHISSQAYMFYRPLPLVVQDVGALFRFSIAGYEKELGLIALIGIIATLLGMVVPQATGMLMDQAIPGSNLLLLKHIGLVLFATAFAQAAFQLSQGIMTLRLETVADGNLQLAVWDRLLKLSPSFFQQYTSGDLVNRLLAIREIHHLLSGATQRTLLSGVFALLNLGLMFIYSIKLALVALGLSVIAVIVTVVSGVVLVRKERKQEALDGEIDGLTVQLINGVAKLRVAAAEERAFWAWAEKYSQKTKLTAGIQRINDSLSTFNEALPLISSVILFCFTLLFIQINQEKNLPNTLTAGTFLAFQVAFGTYIGGVTSLSNTLTDILGIVPMWERAKSIFQEKPESDINQQDPGRLSGHLVLDHLSFRYREDGPLIIDDISIHANPGEFIALVGPSGSGKSTLFRLLLGFASPITGTIYYDGQDLAGLDVTALRRQLGVVLQNGHVQQGSIFHNITSGALVSHDVAWEAARMAGLAVDIEKMPMGMHTVISEGGSNLSGGQRQRLLIARALVNKPKIILMDEATSALDNRTQEIVTDSLEQLHATRIVIAHRLSTIRNADRIYVLEAGRIVQTGTFAQLSQEEGLFARLVARQLD
ncbi:NHLP bacteriocin export ABC transporter permease/ATPase subunit [Moorena bouillonii]|uniref:NHLP bacteriocin export ABC transporter permease/ATPase subunit n=1 Tax=Moorena bouillonii TaxID=207920 RepID=UPI0018E931A6|nr:NHLP bacteriocin export ABC transporter permease/ATPase subunit [Moorena bouillonii]